MAKVLNSSIGQLSGKMGGMVFSRNKGGAYVRAGVKGNNPQTQTQLKARYAFGSVATLFRSLTSAEKTSWQEFADNYYSPRNGGNAGQFSGYNAFIALRSAVQQAYLRPLEPVIKNTGVDISSGITFTDFTPMPETPIAKSFAPAVKTTGGDNALLSVKSAVIETDGSFNVVLQVGDGTGVDLAGNVDENGYEIGYAVYISNGNPSDNMSYNNQFAVNLGYVKPWNATAPGTDLLAVETIGVDSSVAFPIGSLKRFPLLDEYVNVTVYAFNKYGMFTRIGNIETQIT